MLAGIACSVREHGHPSPPLMLLSGGETVVTMTSPSDAARGSRNTEPLSFALANAGRDEVWAFACDTDGIDGSGHAARRW